MGRKEMRIYCLPHVWKATVFSLLTKEGSKLKRSVTQSCHGYVNISGIFPKILTKYSIHNKYSPWNH